MKFISQAALCCILMTVVGCGRKKQSQPVVPSEPIVVHEIETDTVVYHDGREDEFKVVHQKVRVSGVHQEGIASEDMVK